MSNERKHPDFCIHDPNPPERTVEAALRLLIQLQLSTLQEQQDPAQPMQPPLPR